MKTPKKQLLTNQKINLEYMYTNLKANVYRF